jgi:hypothetical protein
MKILIFIILYSTTSFAQINPKTISCICKIDTAKFKAASETLLKKNWNINFDTKDNSNISSSEDFEINSSQLKNQNNDYEGIKLYANMQISFSSKGFILKMQFKEGRNGSTITSNELTKNGDKFASEAVQELYTSLKTKYCL